jgi:hypothetical protein
LPAQLDLFGERTRVFKFGRIFGPGAKRQGDSRAEAKVASFLRGRGISFKHHPYILPPARRRKAFFTEREKEELVGGNLSAAELSLVLKKTPLSKIRPELFRSDFLLEGRLDGKPARIFVEYLGLYNPKTKITAKTMRKRHYRALASYTFLKKPLKEALYRRIGAKVIFLAPADIFRLEKTLGNALEIDQAETTIHGGKFRQSSDAEKNK